ncbi:OmpA family protein [Sphingomonas sp.]|jgi:outer membrane protein OmpA-like peptidoglycan-associated protein|uniref:OmpA family protein n=1 Tax=Sphingomonas sp. TaxID=28214 RepID=UPI002DF381D5|nr:OmpA family protein [Sphingomonas sp.]
MVQAHEIRPGMNVITPDGQRIGQVEESDVFGLKLAANSTPDGKHHYVAADLVDHVSADSVHLNRRAQAIMQGANRPHRSAGGSIDRRHLIPWLIAGLLGLLVLVLLLQDRDDDRAVAPVATATDPAVTAPTAAALVVAPVTLPDGEQIELAQGTLAYDVQAFLASREATPRTFSFDALNFETGRSDIRREERQGVDDLARVLAAYPTARVRVVGYTDSRGGELPNQALAYQRARQVAEALEDRGIDENRIEAVSGGESDPLASNSTAQGRFANRRTELIVLNR